jgi:hypothetical protein
VKIRKPISDAQARWLHFRDGLAALALTALLCAALAGLVLGFTK